MLLTTAEPAGGAEVGVSERLRSAEFRIAYWTRLEELIGLMDGAAQARSVDAAKTARIGRKNIKRFAQLVQAATPGPISVEQADRIAKRYALWTVRQKFDWGRQPPGTDPRIQRLDTDICWGIYDLDVTLRRRIEGLLVTRRQEPREAAHLRALVEARAGQLAAALDVAGSLVDQDSDWQRVAASYPEVCDELDSLLTLAGSIASSG